MTSNSGIQWLLAALAGAAAVLLAGCEHGSAGPPPSSAAGAGATSRTSDVAPTGGGSPESTGQPTGPIKATEQTAGLAATNPWFPLEPGIQWIELGTLKRGSTELEHRRVLTVTNVTKMIDGRRSVLVLDQNIDGGEVAEQAIDYLAIDEQGNVVYLGSYTEAYEGGEFVNAADGWLAGVDGAIQGTLLPADPQPGADPYIVIDVPGEERLTASVREIGASLCVPFDCYNDVLVVDEGGSEYKYFARGVGELKLEPNYSGGEQERLELINLTRLSSTALAELSTEALRLDEHARTTAPRVFARSEPAGPAS